MRRNSLAVVLSIIFIFTFSFSPARGDSNSGLLEADLSSEYQMGPTNINGVLGNGRLTAGISLWGEITVLHWPSPSYYDHIQYTTVNGFPLMNTHVRMTPDVGGSYGANLRPLVQSDNMGSFGGMFCKTQDEPGGGMTFFRDNDWTPSQHYASKGVPVLLGDYTNDALKADVATEDVIVPGADVLIRNFSVTLNDGSPVTEWKFAYYANLAPSLDEPVSFPILELFESRHDFAAVYLPQKEILVQFVPEDAPGAVPKLPLLEDVGSPEEIDGLFGEGVYIVMGFDFTPDEFQVGADSFAACTKQFPDNLANAGEDAYADLLDGQLENNTLTACQADFAVMKNASGKTGNFRVLFSVAGTAREAYEKMIAFRSMDAGEIRESTASDWQAWIERRKIRFDKSEVDDFIKNTLMTIRISQDASTKAVVASIATQPAYNFDWPRDGSFINLFLDLMGYTEDVEKHEIFYSEVQRRSPLFFGLAGSWFTYYWANGPVGTFYPTFEIDETGLTLWSMYTHSTFMTDEAERDAYLQKVFPAIEMGADLLDRCRDETNGMQCPANEDDNFPLTQTLHGATAVYAGLVSAAKAARILGNDQAFRWEKRAADLKEAILSFYNETEGHFENEGWRGGEWLIYPAAILPIDDPRIKSQADYIRETDVLPNVNMETDGFAYLSEKLFALALADRNNQEKLDEVKAWMDFLLQELPTKDTGHLGEVALVGDFNLDGEKEFVNVTSIPHVWEATVLSLALIAAYHPEAFDQIESDDDTGADDTGAGDASTESFSDSSPSGCGCP